MDPLTVPDARARRSEASIVLLGTLLCLCSSGPFYVVPAYLEAIQSGYGLSLGQLGTVSGLESFGIAAACTLSGLFIRRLGWRATLASALLCVVGNLLTVEAKSFGIVLSVRTLLGVLGEGPLYAMGYAVLG